MLLYVKNVLFKEYTDAILKYLRDNIEWKVYYNLNNKILRKVQIFKINENLILDDIIQTCLFSLSNKQADLKFKFENIVSIYLNYLSDGSNYIPDQIHHGFKEILIFLGADRKIMIADHHFHCFSGDFLIFDSTNNGIRKYCNVFKETLIIHLFLHK